MQKLKHIKYRNREEWLRLRKQLSAEGRCGGSDIATIIRNPETGMTGYNPFNSALQLFYMKLGLTPSEIYENESMFWGTELEPQVAEKFQYWDGTEEGYRTNFRNGNIIRKVRQINSILINPKYRFIFANPDRLVVPQSSREGLECKTIREWHSNKYEGGVVPYHVWQTQLYMLVTGYDVWYIASLMGDGKAFHFDVVPIEANKRLQDRIIEDSTWFGELVLQGREIIEKYGQDEEEMWSRIYEIEPEPDDSEAIKEFYSEQYLEKLSMNVVEGDEDTLHDAISYKRLLNMESRIKTQKLLRSNRIKHEMRHLDAKKLEWDGWGNASWTKSGGFRVNIDL